MRSGTSPFICKISGVLAPTQAASCQWVFSSPRLTRLNLVRPPVPHSMGSPNACNRSYNAHLVEFTAAASLSGCRRWDCPSRSEEHTSELQSLTNLVCRLLLEKKKKNYERM